MVRLVKRISFCQSHYALDILNVIGYLTVKLVKLLMISNLKLRQSDSNLLGDPISYIRLIGRLLDLIMPRLDLSYSIQVLREFMDKTIQIHMHATFQVLKYIKGTLGQGIFFHSSSSLHLKAYNDSN